METITNQTALTYTQLLGLGKQVSRMSPELKKVMTRRVELSMSGEGNSATYTWTCGMLLLALAGKISAESGAVL